MKEKEILMSEDDFTILLCALRYALGRHSYICSTVADYIKTKKYTNLQAYKMLSELDYYSNDKLMQRVAHKIDVENWKDLLAYHMSFAKLKFTKTWLARLYKGISDKEAEILETVYDETDSNKDNIIKGTNINFLKKDGSMKKYCAYNMFFKEGILFVYVPFDV